MTLQAALAEGVYYIRILPATSIFTESGTVTWASTTRVAALYVEVVSDVNWTPGWLLISVGNGQPMEAVEVLIDDSYACVAEFDEAGLLVGTSVPLPELAQGAHIVTVNTSTQRGSAVFNVLNPPTEYPSTPPADVAPQPATVARWSLQDPSVDGEPEYIFPINPSKMSTPYAARAFSVEHSSAPDGQPLTFEGFPFGVDWTIEGTCLTEDFHDGLETDLALARRVYLIDHLARAWTVSLESINWTRLPQRFNDWSFTYQLKAIIYAGPVQL